MPQTALANPAQDEHSTEYRASLAKMIMNLFDHWGLKTEDQAALLGLSTKGRTSLGRYRRGQPLADNQDLLDRAGHLLGIHKSLRLIFPHDKELAYRWITQPNQRFDNRSPLDIIKERRFEGLLAVRRYLDFERGR
jgi:Antitoxin Xre/MbcA/ParS C-terminal toxin-binding domain/Antitoxin Xre-like helix-turn-helix domain